MSSQTVNVFVFFDMFLELLVAVVQTFLSVENIAEFFTHGHEFELVKFRFICRYFACAVVKLLDYYVKLASAALRLLLVP